MTVLTIFRSCVAGAALCAVAPLALASWVPERDFEGSRDHPMVSRFLGSVIVGYQSADYDSLQLPMGPYSNGGISRRETVDGRITRIVYAAPEGKSAVEVYNNYAQALSAGGFQARFECHSSGRLADGPQECGGAFDFAHAATHPLLYDMRGAPVMWDVLDPGSGLSGSTFAITSRLQRPEGVVDISLLVVGSANDPTGILLQICERRPQPMATGQVTVDAQAIGEGLAQAGHIALYGITFASDSANLDPASQPTLVQMAKTLTEQPALKVYIVGHTDATGSLAHNLDLSQRRAEAVVAALVADYHIAPGRLSAKGLASYSPVASNDDEAGRARNRRVELVKQ